MKIKLLLVTIAILFVAVLYLLYLNLQKPVAPIVETAAPTLTPVATPTKVSLQLTNPITYRNKKYGYQFDCPKSSTHTVEVTNGDGVTVPYYQERCASGKNSFRVSVYSLSHQQIIENIGNNGYLNTLKDFQLKVEGYDESYYSSILSTFEFTETKNVNSIKSEVEDWSSYTKNSEKLSWDKCISESGSSSDLKDLMSQYPSYIKYIGDLLVVYTSKLDFTPDQVSQFEICESGNITPIKTYSDKILWIGACSSGVYHEGVEKCEATSKQVLDLFETN